MSQRTEIRMEEHVPLSMVVFYIITCWKPLNIYQNEEMKKMTNLMSYPMELFGNIR